MRDERLECVDDNIILVLWLLWSSYFLIIPVGCFENLFQVNLKGLSVDDGSTLIIYRPWGIDQEPEKESGKYKQL